jgi:serine/threonine protein kinase/Flp pilus assembly protein TadD
MIASSRHLLSILGDAFECGSAEEQAAYLDRACRGDPDFRARVEALLKAHHEAGRFLDGSPEVPPLTTVDAPLPERPGTVIGPYKLMEQIGEGGMGLVFVAEQQQPVRRKVALKVVKPGMDSRQVVARFEAERQALALMDHPNIAQVHDGGTTPTGRPYFVMELVKGVPITDYCDQNQVPIRQRLELFLHVCQAVQHAHQKGIIHRDLKPSNVLVMSQDGTPLVKVIDFGVAKAVGQQLTDKTIYTHFAQLVGTPLYMSPEQAGQSGLDVDTRSDIYSLGVLLYELLTGTTPFDKERLKEVSFDELRRIIREEEPAKPSTRISTLGQVASTVSSNRKSDPKQLSRLMRGELDWVVMKALEKDRSRRFETASAFAADVQRYLADEPVLACPPSAWYRLRKFARRNKTALAVTGLILFFIALFGGAAGWVMHDRAMRLDKVVNDLERALDRAELLQGQGNRAEALAAFERAELLAGQSPSDPARDERLASLKERFVTDARDQKFIARFEKLRLEVPVNVRESRVGSSFDELRDAFTEYGIALGDMVPAQAAALIASRPEPVRLHLIAALGESLSMIRHGQPLRQWLLAVLDIADNDPWRARLRQAGQDGNRQVVEQLAREVDVRTQPPSFLLLAARSVYTNTSVRLALFRRIQDAHPADLWANHDLAFELVANRRYAEAVRYFTAALALRPKNAGIYLNRGSALNAAGEVDASIADFRRAIALEPKFAMAHAMLGGALADKKQWDAALAECNEAIRLNPKLWQAWGNRGLAHQNVNRLEQSIADHSQAIKLNPLAAGPFVNRCNAYVMLQQYEKALADSTEAVRLDPMNHLAHGNHAFALDALGRREEAMESYRQAIRLKEAYPEAHANLGNLLAGQGKAMEAEQEYREALRLKPDFPEAHANLGNLLAAQGKLSAALREMQRAEQLLPRGNPHLPMIRASAHRFQKLVELERKLPDLLEHKVEPADAAEGLTAAWLCQQPYQRLYAASARFYADAFAAERKLADDLGNGHRYNAACAAALAGRGQGQDADKLDGNERARLRRQALDWLRADLEAWGRLLDKEPDKLRQVLVRQMRHWLDDPDLAGVRGPQALAKLPEPERQPWQKLWDDVANMLEQAQRKAALEKK